MPLTKEQLEKRKGYIGASDVAAILGLDSRRNAADIWLEKTGKLTPQDEKKVAVWLKDGLRFEPMVLKEARKTLGILTRPLTEIHCSQLPVLAANPDALVKKSGEPVEAKTAGLRNPIKEHWGEPETDQVPDRIIIQASVQIECTKKNVCHIPAFIGGRGYLYYQVLQNEELMNYLLNVVQHFWYSHVQSDVPPEDTVAHIETLKRVIRVPQKGIPINPELITHWLEAKRLRLDAEKVENLEQAELLATLGDAEIGETEGGLITNFEIKRKAYAVEEKTYRQLKWQPKKGT